MEKKIVYVDMDNVLVDFKSGIDKIDHGIFSKYDDRPDEVPGIFSLMTYTFS
jgi:5'-nucleotidase